MRIHKTSIISLFSLTYCGAAAMDYLENTKCLKEWTYIILCINALQRKVKTLGSQNAKENSFLGKEHIIFAYFLHYFATEIICICMEIHKKIVASLFLLQIFMNISVVINIIVPTF